MLVKTQIKVLNVKHTTYKDKNGMERDSFKLTYSQDDDNIVGEINVRQTVYDSVEKSKEYELIGEYMTTRNGNYISWTDAKLALNGGKTLL